MVVWALGTVGHTDQCKFALRSCTVQRHWHHKGGGVEGVQFTEKGVTLPE